MRTRRVCLCLWGRLTLVVLCSTVCCILAAAADATNRTADGIVVVDCTSLANDNTTAWHYVGVVSHTVYRLNNCTQQMYLSTVATGDGGSVPAVCANVTIVARGGACIPIVDVAATTVSDVTVLLEDIQVPEATTPSGGGGSSSMHPMVRIVGSAVVRHVYAALYGVVVNASAVGYAGPQLHAVFVDAAHTENVTVNVTACRMDLRNGASREVVAVHGHSGQHVRLEVRHSWMQVAMVAPGDALLKVAFDRNNKLADSGYAAEGVWIDLSDSFFGATLDCRLPGSCSFRETIQIATALYVRRRVVFVSHRCNVSMALFSSDVLRDDAVVGSAYMFVVGTSALYLNYVDDVAVTLVDVHVASTSSAMLGVLHLWAYSHITHTTVRMLRVSAHQTVAQVPLPLGVTYPPSRVSSIVGVACGLRYFDGELQDVHLVTHMVAGVVSQEEARGSVTSSGNACIVSLEGFVWHQVLSLQHVSLVVTVGNGTVPQPQIMAGLGFLAFGGANVALIYMTGSFGAAATFQSRFDNISVAVASSQLSATVQLSVPNGVQNVAAQTAIAAVMLLANCTDCRVRVDDVAVVTHAIDTVLPTPPLPTQLFVFNVSMVFMSIDITAMVYHVLDKDAIDAYVALIQAMAPGDAAQTNFLQNMPYVHLRLVLDVVNTSVDFLPSYGGAVGSGTAQSLFTPAAVTRDAIVRLWGKQGSTSVPASRRFAPLNQQGDGDSSTSIAVVAATPHALLCLYGCQLHNVTIHIDLPRVATAFGVLMGPATLTNTYVKLRNATVALSPTRYKGLMRTAFWSHGKADAVVVFDNSTFAIEGCTFPLSAIQTLVRPEEITFVNYAGADGGAVARRPIALGCSTWQGAPLPASAIGVTRALVDYPPSSFDGVDCPGIVATASPTASLTHVHVHVVAYNVPASANAVVQGLMVVGLSSATPRTAVGATHSALSLLRLAAHCGDGEGEVVDTSTVGSDAAVNPMQLRVGDGGSGALDAALGATVGNVVLMLCVAVALHCLAILQGTLVAYLAHHRGGSSGGRSAWYRARLQVVSLLTTALPQHGWPGSLTVPLGVLLQPLCTVSAFTISGGFVRDAPTSAPGAAVVGLCCLLAAMATVAWTVAAVLWRFSMKARPIRGKASRRQMPAWRRRLAVLLDPREAWHAITTTRCRTTTTIEPSNRRWLGRWGCSPDDASSCQRLLCVFGSFRGGRHWFFVVEYAAMVFCGVVAGVAMASDAPCAAYRWGGWLLLLTTAVLWGALCGLRPYVVYLEGCCALVCVSLALVVELLAMFGSVEDAETGAVVGSMAELISVVLLLLLDWFAPAEQQQRARLVGQQPTSLFDNAATARSLAPAAMLKLLVESICTQRQAEGGLGS